MREQKRPWGGEPAGQKATGSKRRRLRKESVLRLYFSPVSVTSLTCSVSYKPDLRVLFFFFFPKHVSGCVAQGEGTVGALIVLQMSLTIQMLELAQTGHSREQSFFLKREFTQFV